MKIAFYNTINATTIYLPTCLTSAISNIFSVNVSCVSSINTFKLDTESTVFSLSLLNKHFCMIRYCEHNEAISS